MTTLLHPQLAKDCLPIISLGVCRLYLQNNSNFPWLVLVPMRPNIKEIFELEQVDYEQMMSEVHAVTKHFSVFTKADKMNVATLGNVVSQLHIHIIARFKDAAWPNPVWNANLPPAHYPQNEAELLINELRAIF
jgi:diadenosine tetraphosphate (Ap4A) HIT family hydrolase